MTRLRIKTLHAVDRVDYVHIRHFHEALLRSVRADVTSDPDAEVDFTFGSSRTPQNGKLVGQWMLDPHSLPGDFDPRPLYNRSHLDLLPEPQQRDLLEGLEKLWAGMTAKGGSFVRDVESLGLDIVMLGARWPWREKIAPQLTRCQLMRCSLSVPGAIFYCNGDEKRDIDTFFLGVQSHAHPIRLRMVDALRKAGAIRHVEQPLSNEYIQTSWPSTAAFDQHQSWYADWHRRARIAPFDGSIWDWPTSRYFEAMACGALVVAPMPHDGDILGFQDGVNMVVVDGHDFMDKIWHYLSHEDERARIAAAGAKLVRQHHTCEARADQIIERLEMFHEGKSAVEIEADFDSRLVGWQP